MTTRNMRLIQLLVALAICGWGWSAHSQLAGSAFVVSYIPSKTMMFPAGAVQVSPPQGSLQIGGADPVAKVELLLFGSEPQTLTKPNFQPKDNPQLRYVFKLPDSFGRDTYQCGTSAIVTEVRVTTNTGSVGSKRFELCPRVPIEL
jgi:hypothetical protein